MNSNFERLTLREKAILLSERGSAITRRRHRHYFITLCTLDGDYVEMWYHTFEKRIHKIEILKESNDLDIYLDQIQLKGVHEMLDPETSYKCITEASKRQRLREEGELGLLQDQNSFKSHIPGNQTADPDASVEFDSEELVRSEPFMHTSTLFVLKFIIYAALFLGSIAFRDAFGGSDTYGSEGYDTYCKGPDLSAAIAEQLNTNYSVSQTKVEGDSLK